MAQNMGEAVQGVAACTHHFCQKFNKRASSIVCGDCFCIVIDSMRDQLAPGAQAQRGAKDAEMVILRPQKREKV